MRMEPVGSIEARNHWAARLLVVAIVTCLGLQAWLALVMEVNWDEFFFLSHIYNYQRGEMGKVLQSLYVHLLGWITAIPGDEIDQIRVGRLVMLACVAGTCALVYGLSKTFTSRTAALVAALVFASAGFSIVHAASFRADPLAAVLMMASLVALARGRPGARSMIVAAAAAAVAAMITVKVILYAPAFLGVAVWRILEANDRRRILLWLLGTGAATAAFFVALYLVQLGLLPNATNAGARAGLGNAAETQFAGGLLQRTKEIIQFTLISPVQVVLLLTGLGAALTMIAAKPTRLPALAVLGCGITILCVIIYRNAFPYFFPFILAPSAILAAVAVDAIPLLRKYVSVLGLILSCVAAMVAIEWSGRDLKSQRQVIAAVHNLFPRPVHYIDRNSMISSFPKRGFFMSTWGMLNYEASNVPVIEPLLRADVIPLVIANGPALENALEGSALAPGNRMLSERDKESLRGNFISHWGPLWVAGKVLHAPVQRAEMNILVPGTYTVEGSQITINGRVYSAGSTVELSRGRHIVSAEGTLPITLRWGDHLRRPTDSFEGSVYRGF